MIPPRKKVSKEDVVAARKATGLTQREAAALIGYSERAWQDWELGTRKMRIVLLDLFKIAAASNGKSSNRIP